IKTRSPATDLWPFSTTLTGRLLGPPRTSPPTAGSTSATSSCSASSARGIWGGSSSAKLGIPATPPPPNSRSRSSIEILSA
ncbi:unnamed protein product, partial [Linum tenue]